jgi:rhodanese-related sulfurtransferase
MNTKKTLIIVVIVSALVGSFTAFVAVIIFQKSQEKTTGDLIKEFYFIENAVRVSPHSVRVQMDKGGGNYLLVDLRSPQEYEREHIIGAVNVPAYADPNTPAYQDSERIAGLFKELIAKNPQKDIVVYCYSAPCMTGKKVGKILAEEGIYIKHLGIGWNEWRFYWGMWNHEYEMETRKVEDYVWKGASPGVPAVRELPSFCGDGDFGC